jgi:hypothetical protein
MEGEQQVNSVQDALVAASQAGMGTVNETMGTVNETARA